MTCLYTIERCKAAGETKPYAFNWTLQLSRRWSANTPFAADVRVRPTTEVKQTGYEYASSGGQSSGKKEPSWPKVAGGTVRDGSITWTAVVLSADSLLEEISVSSWDVPTGLIGSGEATVIAPGQQATEIQISDGVPAQEYTIINAILTTEGNTYEAAVDLSIDQ